MAETTQQGAGQTPTRETPTAPSTGTTGLPSEVGLQDFHPFFSPKPSPLYEPYMQVRNALLAVIRNDVPETVKVFDDIADAIMSYDKEFPTGWMSAAKSLLTLGKSVTDQRKKRTATAKVVRLLLEQIFDPGLEFKLTVTDILDAFQHCGINRDKVTREQIEQMYAQIILKLTTGTLRDLTYEQQIHGYIRLKLAEIKQSRFEWGARWR